MNAKSRPARRPSRRSSEQDRGHSSSDAQRTWNALKAEERAWVRAWLKSEISRRSIERDARQREPGTTSTSTRSFG